jgi:hypothetical protein
MRQLLRAPHWPSWLAAPAPPSRSCSMPPHNYAQPRSGPARAGRQLRYPRTCLHGKLDAPASPTATTQRPHRLPRCERSAPCAVQPLPGTSQPNPPDTLLPCWRALRLRLHPACIQCPRRASPCRCQLAHPRRTAAGASARRSCPSLAGRIQQRRLGQLHRRQPGPLQGRRRHAGSGGVAALPLPAPQPRRPRRGCRALCLVCPWTDCWPCQPGRRAAQPWPAPQHRPGAAARWCQAAVQHAARSVCLYARAAHRRSRHRAGGRLLHQRPGRRRH